MAAAPSGVDPAEGPAPPDTFQALAERVDILEIQVEDLQKLTGELRHVLASVLRQTPHLYPFYERYLKGFGEDGGGGK